MTIYRACFKIRAELGCHKHMDKQRSPIWHRHGVVDWRQVGTISKL